jgi:hypothetical protein
MVLAPLFYAPAATFTLLAPLALWRCLWLPFNFKGKKEAKEILGACPNMTDFLAFACVSLSC